MVNALIGLDLDLDERRRSNNLLDRPESEVLKLFTVIQAGAFRYPTTDTSVWIRSGFCHCKTSEQREMLRSKYFALAAFKATFVDIASAYGSWTIPDLMIAHGIDISDLETEGIKLAKPSDSEYAVLRLMLGVRHALSGRFCSCFRVNQARNCHVYFETHLDIECDSAYGFHLTNSWERWQLLNFYQYVFSLPGFDVSKMAEATVNKELEQYLNTLVPDMRRKIMDLDRASSTLYPMLKGRIQVQMLDSGERREHLACHCRVHDLVGPPGLRFAGSASDILSWPGFCRY